jgi:hypothetical protein
MVVFQKEWQIFGKHRSQLSFGSMFGVSSDSAQIQPARIIIRDAN